MLLSISPKLTLAALGLIPLLGTTAMLKRLSTRRQAKLVAEKLADANARADERLKNLRTVKVFVQEQREAEYYHMLVRDIGDLRARVAFSEGVFMGSLNFAMTSSLLGIMCFGGLMVKKGELSGGKLTAFMGYTMWLGLGAASLANIRAKTIKTVAASRNVFRVLDATDATRKHRSGDLCYVGSDSGSDRGGGGNKKIDGSVYACYHFELEHFSLWCVFLFVSLNSSKSIKINIGRCNDCSVDPLYHHIISKSANLQYDMLVC